MRKKLTRRGSKKLFRKTSRLLHKKNVTRPLRGGIRL